MLYSTDQNYNTYRDVSSFDYTQFVPAYLSGYYNVLTDRTTKLVPVKINQYLDVIPK